jgi:hypothetical protein
MSSIEFITLRQKVSVAVLKGAIALSFSACCEPALAANCNAPAVTFLSRPSQRSLSDLQAHGQDCWGAIGDKNYRLNALFRTTSEGNRWAASYLLKHLNKLDGGNLEDAFVAIGQFGDHDMRSLLDYSRQGALPSPILGRVLRMLPLSISDDFGGQLKILEARRRNIEAITQNDLASQKTVAMGAIEQAEARIKSKIK